MLGFHSGDISNNSHQWWSVMGMYSPMLAGKLEQTSPKLQPANERLMRYGYEWNGVFPTSHQNSNLSTSHIIFWDLDLEQIRGCPVPQKHPKSFCHRLKHPPAEKQLGTLGEDDHVWAFFGWWYVSFLSHSLNIDLPYNKRNHYEPLMFLTSPNH